ncbi:unnamed protein product [Clavelina lepadiformis]
MQAFGFHPHSYILPNEYTRFVSEYAKESQKHGRKNLYWICKPVDLSRGRGIFVFHDLKHLTYDCSVVVQRYITNPFLISGYKFDLRIYVCVPTFHPLTIYMYQEGIVRFSTDKFDLNQLNNVFSHLTNTSINKYGPSYGVDKERVGSGCKWTLSQLRSYLHQLEGFDEILLWHQISNIITLTLATQSPSVPKCQNCFEVFGFDILVDDQMTPWLLEVNFSPALSMDCQADFIAKRSMLNDLIDLLNFKESDAEHGGKEFRESCISPTPSSGRKNTVGSYGVRSSNSKSGSAKVKYVQRDGNHRLDLKSKTSQKNVVTYKPVEAEQKRQYIFGKPQSDKSKNVMDGSKLKKPPQSLSLPTIRRMSTDSMESASSKTSCEGFPRNLSSSSVASSGSSVDRSNQPKSAQDLDNFTSNVDVHLMKTPRKLSVKNISSKVTHVDNSKNHDFLQDVPSLSTIVEARPSSSYVREDNIDHSDVLDSGRSVPLNKTISRKKSLNSAPVSRTTSPNKKYNPKSNKPGSGKPKLKSFANYKSPYSIASTAAKKTAASNPWPRTRVGDFILTFPLNEAMRRASGFHYDMKGIIREQQKMLKKLTETSQKRTEARRKSSTTLDRSEAIQLSFQLKFDDKDANPLYFWGPQNPPLLSNILS